MIWFLAGALVASLLYIGRILSNWKATTEAAYMMGWWAAMKMRDGWDKSRTVNAISDNMLMKVSRNGKELVN